MRTIKNFEKKERGTPVFPCSIYRIKSDHPDYVMPFHWHTEYEIIVVRNGKINFSINDTPVSAEAGDAVFVSEGILHGGTPEGEACVYDCIVFASDFLTRSVSPELLGGLFYGSFSVNTLIKSAEFPEISEAAIRLCDSFPTENSDGGRLLFLGLLIALFGKIIDFKAYSADVPKTNKHIGHLKEVLRFIEENYSEKITLDDLANAANVSPKYLCRSFSSLTGKTPIEYLNEYRVDCACEMLRTTDVSLVDIACACGFADQSYFIRIFRRQMNMTPRSYRQTGFL